MTAGGASGRQRLGGAAGAAGRPGRGAAAAGPGERRAAGGGCAGSAGAGRRAAGLTSPVTGASFPGLLRRRGPSSGGPPRREAPAWGRRARSVPVPPAELPPCCGRRSRGSRCLRGRRAVLAPGRESGRGLAGPGRGR